MEQLERRLRHLVEQTRRVWGRGGYLFAATSEYAAYVLRRQIADISAHPRDPHVVANECCDILTIIVQWFDRFHEGGLLAYLSGSREMASPTPEVPPSQKNPVRYPG